MRRALIALALAVFAASCSRGVELNTVGISYEPPSGMKLTAEDKGPPATAKFKDGLEIRSIRSPLPGTDDAHLAQLLTLARDETAGTLPDKVVSAKTGAIPAGKVGRWELDGGATRTLLYVVDGDHRHLVVTLTAPKDDFDRRANRVERSLASLKFR